MRTLRFSASAADVVNPERGPYVGVDLMTGEVPASIRQGGHALAIALVQLDAYRDAPLDAAFLAALARGLAAVRGAGIKVILRFRYNADPGPDASRARILAHLAQLEPVLRANADVIAVMQAGFIGAWGEWHDSTNGLDNDVDRGVILNAILAALPASRHVEVRTPMFKEATFPGGPLADAEAFTGTPRARVGHHDDCFLASVDDQGTYAAPISRWKAYVAQDGLYTPIGGETCALDPPRTDCAAALEEMSAHHWSYLNQEYDPAVLAAWVQGGCADEIRRRLGYRFVVERFACSESASPGGELALEMDVANLGFAAPYNARPVYVVIGTGATRRALRLEGVDARRFAPGATTTIRARVPLPADLPAGTTDVALWLPDDAPSLRDDPRYAVRLAQDGVWDEATGLNVLARDLAIAIPTLY